MSSSSLLGKSHIALAPMNGAGYFFYGSMQRMLTISAVTELTRRHTVPFVLTFSIL
jgi:hypothetical protein